MTSIARADKKVVGGLPRGSVTAERLALADEVARLRDQEGLLYREICERLDISYSYTQALYNDPDGSEARARKDRYRGVCVECGGPTTGSEGRDKAPERCAKCAGDRQHEERKWTRESIIDAIQRFAKANGRPPLADEWVTADPMNGYPPRSAIYGNGNPGRGGYHWQPFKKWSDAIEAAGFERPRVGQYVRRPRSHTPRGRYVRTTKGAHEMRDYIILELDDDGRWIEHPPVQSYSEALAIETYIESVDKLNGQASHKFVAISGARWIVRELQTVTSFKAVAAGTASA